MTLGYLAGADADRAADLQAAWCDPDVAGVLCARGGYGAQRMVDLLDWSAMREPRPPRCSSATATSPPCTRRSRRGSAWSPLHGPMVGVQSFLKDGAAPEQLRGTALRARDRS